MKNHRKTASFSPPRYLIRIALGERIAAFRASRQDTGLERPAGAGNECVACAPEGPRLRLYSLVPKRFLGLIAHA
jgi:hypothetical protein